MQKKSLRCLRSLQSISLCSANGQLASLCQTLQNSSNMSHLGEREQHFVRTEIHNSCDGNLCFALFFREMGSAQPSRTRFQNLTQCYAKQSWTKKLQMFFNFHSIDLPHTLVKFHALGTQSSQIAQIDTDHKSKNFFSFFLTETSAKKRLCFWNQKRSEKD